MFYESVPFQIRCRYEILRNRLNLAGIGQEFITISKLTLEHATGSKGINYESVKNMLNAARIGHKLIKICNHLPRFARFSLTIVIKRPIHGSGHQFQNDCSS